MESIVLLTIALCEDVPAFEAKACDASIRDRAVDLNAVAARS